MGAKLREMTNLEFEQKIDHLLNGHNGEDIKTSIKKACMGIFDEQYTVKSYLEGAENDFILPKIALTAVLECLAWQYEPIQKDQKRKIKQLTPFVRF